MLERILRTYGEHDRPQDFPVIERPVIERPVISRPVINRPVIRNPIRTIRFEIYLDADELLRTPEARQLASGFSNTLDYIAAGLRACPS